MKKALTVLIYVDIGLSSVFAILFAFLNFRSLYAGDGALMNDEIMGAATFLLRWIYFLVMLGSAIWLTVDMIIKKKRDIYKSIFSTAVAVSGIFLFFCYEWYIGLAILVLNAGLAVARWLFLEKEEPQQAQ